MVDFSGWFCADNASIMRLVKRVVKWVCWLLGLLAALILIGMVWGLTPYPKPPKGVRLTPLNPPLTLTELRTNNAAYFYFKACGQLMERKPSDALKFQVEEMLDGKTNIDTGAIEATIADRHEALELVRKGMTVQTCQMAWIDFAGEPARYREKLRQLGRLLESEGKLAERTGDADKAMQAYIAAAKLGRDYTHGGPVLSMLIGNAITARATRAIRYALRRNELHSGVAGVTQSQLEQLRDSGQAYDETLRYELVYSKQLAAQTFTQASGAMRGSYSHLADAAFGELIEDAKNPFCKRHGNAIIHKWSLEGHPTWTWVWNRPVARIILGMMLPTIDDVGRRAVRADVDFQATIVACALRRYELAHGNPPEQLADLVPDFLPLLPMDPFDCKTLRYRREGMEWVLWSVGSDLKDDNAAWHEFKYRKQHGENRAGGDIYFKSTEPQDDLAFYLSQKDSKGKR